MTMILWFVDIGRGLPNVKSSTPCISVTGVLRLLLQLMPDHAFLGLLDIDMSRPGTFSFSFCFG